MRISVLVDGEAEYRALPHLLQRIECPHTILSPLVADIQPFAPVAKIVGAVRRKLALIARQDVDMLLLLIDRESRQECSGEFAMTLQDALTRGCTDQLGIGYAVVLKNRRFENWLVADHDAVSSMKSRFDVSDNVIHRIVPNKADNVDALKILKDAAQRDAYSKVADAVRIMKKAIPERIGENSRSFRRMLRVIDHPAYATQSKAPVSVK